MANIRKKSLIVLIIMLIVFVIILKDDFANIVDSLLVANIWLIILSIIIIFIYYIFKALGLYIIVRECEEKITFGEIFHQTLITQFFNGITPFSTGGQPMQVYMLKVKGIKIASATNIIVQEFIMFQLALITHGLLALFINWKYKLFDVSSTLQNLILIGFIINILVGLFLILVSFSRRFNSFIGNLIIKLGTKFKIIKNKEKTITNWELKLKEFHKSAEILKRKKLLFIKGYLYNLLGLFAFYIIPLFVFISLGIDNITVMEIFTSSAFVLIIGNFVPIPGGSGGIEYGFLQFFGSFIKGPTLSASLIIWRFVTYYLGIIIGGIALGFFKGEKKKCV